MSGKGKTKMKIGILGGTFDPVHLAHIQLARTARDAFGLDEVWLMPAKIPPHKQSKQIASEEHRSRMISLAIQGEEGLRLSTFELERDAVSYTAETLRLLRRDYPSDKFYYIMGEDSLLGFAHWYHPEKIVQEAEILVAPRPEGDGEALDALMEERKKYFGNHFFRIPTPWLPVSSTEIRERLEAGQPLSDMLSRDVWEYIMAHGLYREAPELLYLRKALKASLSEKRFYHTEGVAYTAAALAMRYGASLEEALLAGWLHDCAKEKTGEELKRLCLENGLAVSLEEADNLQLLHGKVGAYVAEHTYGVKQPSVLQAIRYHVTGRPDMTLLEQIVYVADFIEPSRKMKTNPELSRIRAMAFESLPKAVFWITGSILEHLETQHAVLDGHTRETYEFYKKKTEEQTCK